MHGYKMCYLGAFCVCLSIKSTMSRLRREIRAMSRESAVYIKASRATVMVVRGPYTAIPAPASSRPLMPTSRFPGHTPKMVPTAKFVSMMDDPSRGSNATEYPCKYSTSPLRPSQHHSITAVQGEARLTGINAWAFYRGPWPRK